MILFILLFILILIVIIIFASPQLSPIPYFPSNAHDLPLIIKALNLKKDTVIFDLGAGDGIIVFSAAHEALYKKLNTKFVAVEMNPILALILHVRRLFHPNKDNISIEWGDMFKVHYSKFISKESAVTVYVYVSPRFIPKITHHVQTFCKHFYFVSYFYPIEKNSKPISHGTHDIYSKHF